MPPKTASKNRRQHYKTCTETGSIADKAVRRERRLGSSIEAVMLWLMMQPCAIVTESKICVRRPHNANFFKSCINSIFA
jgi:hypothetical protein